MDNLDWFLGGPLRAKSQNQGQQGAVEKSSMPTKTDFETMLDCFAETYGGSTIYSAPDATLFSCEEKDADQRLDEYGFNLDPFAYDESAAPTEKDKSKRMKLARLNKRKLAASRDSVSATTKIANIEAAGMLNITNKMEPAVVSPREAVFCENRCEADEQSPCPTDTETKNVDDLENAANSTERRKLVPYFLCVHVLVCMLLLTCARIL
jgi:hypothetical protein